MDGLRLDSGLLGHALGGAAGGRRQQNFRPLGGDDPQDGVEQRRLADAGAAGDDRNLRPEDHRDRGALRRGQRLAGLLLDPWNCLVGVDRRPWRRPLPQSAQQVGDAALGEIQPPQENAGSPLDCVRHDLAAGKLMSQGHVDDAGVDFEQCGRKFDQIVCRQTAMTLVGGLLQCEGNAGPHPLRRLPRHAELHRYGVGGAEADAPDVAREPVGILGHHRDRVMSVGLEDANRARRADTIGVQEEHDVADGLLLGPAGGDFCRAEFAYARDVPAASRGSPR